MQHAIIILIQRFYAVDNMQEYIQANIIFLSACNNEMCSSLTIMHCVIYYTYKGIVVSVYKKHSTENNSRFSS